MLRRLKLAVVLLIACASAAAAQGVDPARHFSGKTLKLVIPSGPGGAYGLYGLLFAQHFGRHVPGNPAVTPEYRSGAGGIVASNYLYNVAPRDGTVIAIPLAPFVLAQLTGGASIQYDVARFNWIGQIADITRVLIVMSSSPVKSFEDYIRQEVVVGSTGRGSETYMNPAIVNAVFGSKLRIVDGYKGSGDLMVAFERGEIASLSATWSNLVGNHAAWLKEEKIRVLAQIGLKKAPGAGSVPLLQEIATREEDKQLIELMSLVTTAVGYSVLAPPGVPDDVLAVLRKAFDDTMRDPVLLADARKRNIEIAPEDHTTVADAVARAVRSPKTLFERLSAAIGSKPRN